MDFQGIRSAQGGLNSIFNQGRSLMKVDNRRSVVGYRVVMDGLAAVANFASIQRVQPGQRPQQQRFPRSRGAGKHEARPRPNCHRDVVQQPRPAIRVTAADMLGFQDHTLLQHGC